MIRKLGNGETIDMQQLKRYKALSKDDMKDDKWMFPPILVSTNRERIYIIEMQATTFSKQQGTYLIRRIREFQNCTGRPKNS